MGDSSFSPLFYQLFSCSRSFWFLFGWCSELLLKVSSHTKHMGWLKKMKDLCLLSVWSRTHRGQFIFYKPDKGLKWVSGAWMCTRPCPSPPRPPSLVHSWPGHGHTRLVCSSANTVHCVWRKGKQQHRRHLLSFFPIGAWMRISDSESKVVEYITVREYKMLK